MCMMLTATLRKSNVPTVVEVSNGVNTMWFLGEMTVMLKVFFASRSCANRAPAQPVPSMTTLGLPWGIYPARVLTDRSSRGAMRWRGRHCVAMAPCKRLQAAHHPVIAYQYGAKHPSVTQLISAGKCLVPSDGTMLQCGQ
mmetsp:Transcript_13406/g.33686  ORF Transcript_13406/g.33686 Transcript_13406/m.33686 type:complete len:140 (+) Transcript_13406:1006-1425(+)